MKAGWEGIVSKKVNSPYRVKRNGDWVKVKARPSDVVGFTEPKGGRAGIGALLLAKRFRGEWVYIGSTKAARRVGNHAAINDGSSSTAPLRCMSADRAG